METITLSTDFQNRANVPSGNYLQELRAKMPEKLNKLGEWFFSRESNYHSR